MKKIIVSGHKKSTVPKKLNPENLANNLLINSGFKSGTEAHVKYSHGKLKILIGKMPKLL